MCLLLLRLRAAPDAKCVLLLLLVRAAGVCEGLKADITSASQGVKEAVIFWAR
jgi:hypothetical protein